LNFSSVSGVRFSILGIIRAGGLTISLNGTALSAVQLGVRRTDMNHLTEIYGALKELSDNIGLCSLSRPPESKRIRNRAIAALAAYEQEKAALTIPIPMPRCGHPYYERVQGGELACSVCGHQPVSSSCKQEKAAGQVKSDGWTLESHLQHQREWSDKTFGPGPRAEGVVDHISKELVEILNAPWDLSEWIDVVILAFDGAGRAGFTPHQIITGLREKQAENELRTWFDWRTAPSGKAICHIEAAEQHCPACAMVQNLERGEGTHLEGTAEHPRSEFAGAPQVISTSFTCSCPSCVSARAKWMQPMNSEEPA
jgi:hypothetical protein